MENNPQQDKVWLSREEYDRLRTAQQTPAGVYSAPTQTGQPVTYTNNQVASGSSYGSYAFTAAMIVCAILSYTMPIFTIVFIIVGIIAIFKAAAQKGKKTVPLALSITILIIGFVAITPMLLLFVLIGWFQINCWFDATACRSV
jgi:hypothetical protein